MRAELSAILEGDDFSHAPVQSKLLAYLVEQTLAGNGDRLKSYAIAVDGLGRPDTFDAQSDSYPRVQMSRLRKALDHHYAAHGPVDGSCLYLKPGSYRVRIGAPDTAYPHHYRAPARSGTAGNTQASALVTETSLAEPSSPVEPDDAVQTGSIRPAPRLALGAAFALLVMALFIVIGWRAFAPTPATKAAMAASSLSPVVEVGTIQSAGGATDPGPGRQASGLIVDGLTRSWVAQVRAGSGVAAPGSTPAAYRLDLQLDTFDATRDALSGRLVDLRTATVIWSGSTKLSNDPAALPDELAPLIARLIGPYGVIALNETTRLTADDAPGYACLLKYVAFLQSRDAAITARVARCLKQPPDEPRLAATLFAVRAFFALESTLGTDRQRARAAAEGFARQAVDANSQDPYAQYAMARIAYLRSDCAAGNVHTDRAVAGNPNDPMILAVLAALSYACAYPQAEALLDRAFRLRSDGDVYARPFLILASLSQGKPERILELGASTRPAAGPLLANYLLTETLVAAAQGRGTDAAVLWKEFRALYPGTGPSDEAKLRTIILSDVLRKRVLTFLTAKGVTTGEVVVFR